MDRQQAPARLGLAQLRSNGSMTLGAQIVTLCCLQSALNNNTGKNCISRPLALSLSLAATCNKTVQCLQCPHRCSHITPWCTHWHRDTALTAAVTPHSLRTWGFLLFTPLMRHVTSLIWHRVVTSTDVTPSTHCGQLARCQQTVRHSAVRAEPGGEWRGPGADTNQCGGWAWSLIISRDMSRSSDLYFATIRHPAQTRWRYIKYMVTAPGVSGQWSPPSHCLCLAPGPGDETVPGWWEPQSRDRARTWPGHPVINEKRGYLFWLICNYMFLPPVSAPLVLWSRLSSDHLPAPLILISWFRSLPAPHNCLNARISPDPTPLAMQREYGERREIKRVKCYQNWIDQ